MQTGENSIIEKLVYFIIVIRIHSAFVCSKIQLYDVNKLFNSSTPSRLLHLNL